MTHQSYQRWNCAHPCNHLVQPCTYAVVASHPLSTVFLSSSSCTMSWQNQLSPSFHLCYFRLARMLQLVLECPMMQEIVLIGLEFVVEVLDEIRVNLYDNAVCAQKLGEATWPVVAIYVNYGLVFHLIIERHPVCQNSLVYQHVFLTFVLLDWQCQQRALRLRKGGSGIFLFGPLSIMGPFSSRLIAELGVSFPVCAIDDEKSLTERAWIKSLIMKLYWE